MGSSAPHLKHSETVVQLAEARRELAHLVASVPTILICLTPELEVTRWNTKAEEVLGLRAEDLLGAAIDGGGIQWDWPKIAAGLARCRDGRTAVRIDDIAFQSPEGKEGYLGITVNPMLDEAGATRGFIIIGADITDRKALMNQLNQSQRLKSIGQLAAGIAHEINTPTQYVGDNIRFLKESFDDLSQVLDCYGRLLAAVKEGGGRSELVCEIDSCVADADLDYLVEEIPLAIEHTLEGVARISKIVRAMKEFSHPGREEKVPTDINKAIESTITVARNEWKYVAQMQTDFDPAIPPVTCMPGEINQVVLNMIINAAHAIADARGQEEQDELGCIRISTARDRDYVKIAISDTGTGMPPEIQTRIFDPFFTTKEVGRGTGQGLAICYPVIVEKHGGTIDVESELGKGTTFIIKLPLVGSGD